MESEVISMCMYLHEKVHKLSEKSKNLPAVHYIMNLKICHNIVIAQEKHEIDMQS